MLDLLRARFSVYRFYSYFQYIGIFSFSRFLPFSLFLGEVQKGKKSTTDEDMFKKK